jgi:hypothetical protein
LSVSIAGGSGSGPDVADIPSAVAAGASFVTSGAGASVVAGTVGVASGAFSATVSVGAASATGAGVDSVYIKVSRCSNRCFHDVAIDLG